MIERRRIFGLGLAATLAVSALGLPASADAQADHSGSGRLEGRVVAEDGAPVGGATVTVTSPELDAGDATLQTDGQGQFSVGALRPGLYDLAVEQIGYRAGALATLNVQNGQATRAEIVLQRRAAGDGGY